MFSAQMAISNSFSLIYFYSKLLFLRPSHVRQLYITVQTIGQLPDISSWYKTMNKRRTCFCLPFVTTEDVRSINLVIVLKYWNCRRECVHTIQICLKGPKGEKEPKVASSRDSHMVSKWLRPWLHILLKMYLRLWTTFTRFVF